MDKLIKGSESILQEGYTRNESIWVKKFLKYMQTEKEKINSERANTILKEFCSASIELCKNNLNFTSSSEPILICVVKNELERIKHLYKHHRKLGIRKFAMIDNNSSDGTFEWMLKQEDTEVYRAFNEYSSAKRVAWINKILCHYGYDRWYIVVDADEFLDYIGSESMNIAQMLQIVERRNIKRILGLQIDMYSNKPLFFWQDTKIDFEKYVYFDSDSYELQKSDKCPLVIGGPRKRILNTYSVLTKYPIFYFRIEDINISSHYLYPYSDNFKSEFLIAIFHYEFVNKVDLNRIYEIVKNGNYASNSKEYRQMIDVIEKSENLSFIYSNSARYENSNSIKAIPLIREIARVLQDKDKKNSEEIC